jgi:hypothetical protein
VLPAPGSRACIFLSFLPSQLPKQLSSFFCKLFSPQLFKISQMISSSSKSVFDFLDLAQSWLKILAALGVNFSKSLTAGAEFSFSSESFASIFFRSGHSI